jgi:hypothetical protein
MEKREWKIWKTKIMLDIGEHCIHSWAHNQNIYSQHK